jgi:nucleoside-diphosphate-sugar epimerase
MNVESKLLDVRSAGPSQPRRCLVTGGSGFLGVNLVRRLLADGWLVRSLDLVPFDYPERGRIEAIEGDIRDPAAVDSAMRDVDCVVHCAAALPLAPAQEILTTGVRGTNVLLQHARARGVERFVFISSTAVYGIPDEGPILESHRLAGVGPYGRSKIEAEQLCEEHRLLGQCISILRPKTFVGPERLGVFELLYDWASQGRAFPVLGRGANRYQLLDVRDLCEVILRCLTLERRRVDGTFNVGAVRFGSMADNVQCVLDRAGFKRRVAHLPHWPTVAVLRLLGRLGLSPLYPWIYETADHDSAVSTDKLQRQLGYVPEHSNQEALCANFDWYLANRARFAGRSGITHRLPWRKGVLEWAKYLY